MFDKIPFQVGEVACQKTALSFVDSLWELLGPLLQGVPTVIISDSVLRDPHALVAVLNKQKVTRIWVVPSLLHMLLDSVPDLANKLPMLRFWVSSGETLTVELAQRFQQAMPEASLYNLYGTSEVWDVTWYEATADIKEHTCIPVGMPIANVKTYVLDRYCRPVPVGVPGELYVSGAGLASGYLHEDTLTQERFVHLPMLSEDDALAYSTGDLARYLPDGNLQLMGRLDDQVKVRGYRVEPGEVEAMLSTHPQLNQIAVIQDANSEDRLIAYIVAQSESMPTSNELRHWLLHKLPEYMVPAAFIEIDSFPLTPSGKVDRRMLQVFSIDRPSLEQSYEPPRSRIEKQLAQIWSEILKLERIGIHDSFFDLGGHSLTATQVVTRICSTFNVELTLRTFFQLPTIANIAEILEASMQEPVNLDTPAITRASRDKYRVS
jgi:acyl-coenzyme A synthetase/AMP-(fatty) acid ligase/acyl carrier protein